MTERNARTRLLIFDLDGTLVDSKDDIVESVNLALRSAGLPAFPGERVAAEIGRGSEVLFRRLLGENTAVDWIEELSRRFRRNYERNLTRRTKVYPGIRETLEHYRYLPKVVVTNKNQVFADRLVDDLDLRPHFEAVFGQEAFPTRKPDPGPLREVCRRWNLPPAEAAMIGDSVFDLIAGKAAGLRTVGVLYGLGAEAELRRHRPDFTVRDAREIAALGFA
ncbi:MAG: HAD-IA family hydrolase [Bdellovibrionales bacterium]|nr:HAD-IA family hydrolase [Bdellovibrionales bacterium]